jgi:hypothetical protein
MQGLPRSTECRARESRHPPASRGIRPRVQASARESRHPPASRGIRPRVASPAPFPGCGRIDEDAVVLRHTGTSRAPLPGRPALIPGRTTAERRFAVTLTTGPGHCFADTPRYRACRGRRADTCARPMSWIRPDPGSDAVGGPARAPARVLDRGQGTGHRARCAVPCRVRPRRAPVDSVRSNGYYSRSVSVAPLSFDPVRSMPLRRVQPASVSPGPRPPRQELPHAVLRPH